MDWLKDQFRILLASILANVAWVIVVLALLDVSFKSWMALIVIYSSVLPGLSLIEALIRMIFRKEYTMGVASSVGTAALLVAFPVTAVYLYVVGECLECGQTYWDMALMTLVFAVPSGLIQWLVYRLIRGERYALRNVDINVGAA